MEEQVETMTNVPVPEQVPQRNPGWFRTGDRRINREGRPRGSSKGSSEAADRAPAADRLMLLVLSGPHLAFRLSHPKARWAVNLPKDFEIVSCRFDPVRQNLVLVIRSKEFRRIARGAAIPVFRAEWYGRGWERR